MAKNRKILLLLIFLVISFIILLGLINYLINSNSLGSSPSSNDTSQLNTDAEIAKKNAILGNISVDDSQWNFYMTSILKDVVKEKKEKEDVFVEIESKNSKNEKLTQRLLVFKQGVTKEFILSKTNDFTAVNPKITFTKPTSEDETLSLLSKYKGKTIQNNLHLKNSLTSETLVPYKKYIECNEKILSFMKGLGGRPNCTGLSLEIYVQD